MIRFICPNCESEFDAQFAVRGIQYIIDGQKYKIEQDYYVCHNCLKEIEEAKQQALDRRKKKV